MVLFLSFCRSNFFGVMTCGFHFVRLISQKKLLQTHTSPEGFDPVYKKQYFLTINIFAEGNHFLILLQKESLQYINILISFERFISQKRILLIDTSIEEFYHVHENGIYNNSIFTKTSPEGIFLYFKMCSLDMDIYSTRTLIFQINSKRKSLFFIGPSTEVRKKPFQ